MILAHAMLSDDHQIGADFSDKQMLKKMNLFTYIFLLSP